MAYRDENEALRERVAELEKRLALADLLIARLNGRHGGPSSTRRRDSVVGEVLHHIDELELEVALDEEGLAAAARVAEERLGIVVSRSGGRLTGRRERLRALGERAGEGALAVGTSVVGTTLRLETDLRRLPVVVALGPVLGALVAAPLLLWQMHQLHHFEPAISAQVTIPLLALLMVLGTGFTRAVARRIARAEGERHLGVWAALVALSREHGHSLPRVRVEEQTDVAGDAGDDEGAERPRAKVRSAR